MKQPEALRLANNRHNAHMLTWQANACTELRRLHAIEEAARNLVKVKGRFHTEQAFNKLKELLR